MNKTWIIGGVVASLLVGAGVVGAVSAQPDPADAAFSEAQAVEIALAAAPGDVEEIEFEREDGALIYEIEILTADGVEMEVEIDAMTGAVLEIEIEDEDGDDDD